MTDKYSFIELFCNDIVVDKHQKAKIQQIVIPKIQRPYAQGRQDVICTFIRNKFLNELLDALSSGQKLELNFVYGIMRQDNINENYVLELLDGQQRLTTLFLIHWYICNRELESESNEDSCIRSCLSKFVYETRSTATTFCKMLSQFKVDIPSSSTPRSVICSARWYFKSFDRDSTIAGMLVMLDAIHEKYEKYKYSGLNPNLNNLQFYIKSLGYFNLSEDLYIKMNARGLQLSAFENFKADFIDHITNNKYNELVPLYSSTTDNVPFHFNFASKLDAKWIDIFWKRGVSDFDIAYMSFFYRYFACKYIANSKDSVTDIEMRSDDYISQIFTNAEKRWDKNEYLGFNLFSSQLKQNPKFVYNIDKLLDVFHKYHKDISTELAPIWEHSSDRKSDNFYCCMDSKINQSKLIVLSAVIEFIEAYDDFDITVFKQWMRVVWNVVENTNIDSLTPVTILIRHFSNIIKDAAVKSRKSISFYEALSNLEDDYKNRAIKEEVLKAKYIAEDFEWEGLFSKNENHPFFKGMISFYFSEKMDQNSFMHSSDLISKMFDANGISNTYKQKHVLIRAIVSRLSSWDALKNKYITERSESNKYLKNILTANVDVRNMFSQLSFLSDEKSIIKSLVTDFIEDKQVIGSPEDAVDFAFQRLKNDIYLYDWIAADEEKNKCFRIYWYCGHVNIAKPYHHYARLIIDTERNEMARQIATKIKFVFSDPNQQSMLEKYGDCFGKDIFLHKQIDKYHLRVKFSIEHKFIMQVECKSKNAANKLVAQFEKSTVCIDDGTYVNLPELKYERMASFALIQDTIISTIEQLQKK